MNREEYIVTILFWILMSSACTMLFITLAACYVKAMLDPEPGPSSSLLPIGLFSFMAEAAVLYCHIKALHVYMAFKKDCK